MKGRVLGPPRSALSPRRYPLESDCRDAAYHSKHILPFKNLSQDLFSPKDTGLYRSHGAIFDLGDLFERKLIEIGQNNGRMELFRKPAQGLLDPALQAALFK